jgi:hypothetical protein
MPEFFEFVMPVHDWTLEDGTLRQSMSWSSYRRAQLQRWGSQVRSTFQPLVHWLMHRHPASKRSLTHVYDYRITDALPLSESI